MPNTMQHKKYKSLSSMLLDDFLESGRDCIAKKYESAEEALQASWALRGYLRRHNCPVKIHVHKNRLFLVRESA